MPVQPTTKNQANGQIINNKKRATDNAATLSTSSSPHANNKQQKSLQVTSAAANGEVEVSNNNIRHGRNNSNTSITNNTSNSSHQSARQSRTIITPKNVVNGNNNVHATQNGTIKLRDDIDDDEEFATIEEALTNSAPPRKPVTNVAAPQRHVGKPLLRAAPVIATPLTQQKNALASHVQYDDNYASDFDAYDDDFEEEFVEDDLGRTSFSSTSALAAASTPVPPERTTKLPTNSRETDKTIKNEISDSTALPKVDVLLLHNDVNAASEKRDDAIDFRSAAQHSQQHARVAARRAAKFDTIRQLVQFDYAHHRHFTLTPAGTHARYLELFGKQNVKLAASQTADERREQEMQTEEPERANAWTQHPGLSANLVSDREDFLHSSTNSTTLHQAKPPVVMPNSSSIVQFIAQASDCIVKLLNESHKGKHQTSNVWLSLDGKSDIFASVSLIGPPESHVTSSIDYSSVLCMACSEPKMDRIATCHPSLPGYQQQQQQQHQSAALNASMAVVLVWNAGLPFTPEAVLYTQDPNSRIVCCIFHKLDPHIIIAGCSDGSLVCWSIRTTTSFSRQNAVQMSLGSAATKLIPLFLPEFSSAPLAGHSPPHVASIVALEEFIDKNGSGHRVGISGVSSSCTLASLDACAALCLWNVVTNNNNTTSDSAFSSVAPVSAVQSVATKTTPEAIGILGEFCLTPPSLSTVLESSSTNKRLDFVAIKLTVLSTMSISTERLTSSRFAGDHTSNLINFDGTKNCMIRFSPFYSNGAILACLFDGRLYRVNSSSSTQQKQKVIDCTPRNNNGFCANIVSFAFPPSASSTSTTTLYQRHIVACLHDVGSLMFLSLETGQLLTTWSSPLMGVGVNVAEVAHSIWWPKNGAIIVVGTDATVVRFQFQSDEIIDSCWPVVTTDASMSSSQRMTTTKNSSGDRTMQNNTKCVVSSYGSSEAMKLAILTSSGPITMLKIR